MISLSLEALLLLEMESQAIFCLLFLALSHESISFDYWPCHVFNYIKIFTNEAYFHLCVRCEETLERTSQKIQPDLQCGGPLYYQKTPGCFLLLIQCIPVLCYNVLFILSIDVLLARESMVELPFRTL